MAAMTIAADFSPALHSSDLSVPTLREVQSRELFLKGGDGVFHRQPRRPVVLGADRREPPHCVWRRLEIELGRAPRAEGAAVWNRSGRRRRRGHRRRASRGRVRVPVLLVDVLHCGQRCAPLFERHVVRAVPLNLVAHAAARSDPPARRARNSSTKASAFSTAFARPPTPFPFRPASVPPNEKMARNASRSHSWTLKTGSPLSLKVPATNACVFGVMAGCVCVNRRPNGIGRRITRS